MTSKEALENIKSRINSLSLFPKVDRKTYDESWEVIEKDLEVLEWLIENLYVAPELLELRLTDTHNNSFSDKGIKYHNGIEIKNKDFRKYIDRIHELKYGR